MQIFIYLSVFILAGFFFLYILPVFLLGIHHMHVLLKLNDEDRKKFFALVKTFEILGKLKKEDAED